MPVYCLTGSSPAAPAISFLFLPTFSDESPWLKKEVDKRGISILGLDAEYGEKGNGQGHLPSWEDVRRGIVPASFSRPSN